MLASLAVGGIISSVRTVAVINQKGGVGKTTTAANLGAAIGQAGYDICLLDLDPQAHLTLHFGIEPGAPALSSYDVMTQDKPLAPATMMVKPHVWVVPSVIDLAAAEIELVSTVGREQILRDRLEEAPLPYDVVMIDCPPSLGLLTLNALAAADEVVIPLQPHFLALQGLGKLLETVSLVQRRINPRLRVSGVVMCMYERNTRLANEVLADLREFFTQARDTRLPWSHARIFDTVIRRNIKLAECPSFGRTIFDYEPGSNGAKDYLRLAMEFLEGMGPPQAKTAASASSPASVVVPSVKFRPPPPPGAGDDEEDEEEDESSSAEPAPLVDAEPASSDVQADTVPPGGEDVENPSSQPAPLADAESAPSEVQGDAAPPGGEDVENPSSQPAPRVDASAPTGILAVRLHGAPASLPTPEDGDQPRLPAGAARPGDLGGTYAPHAPMGGRAERDVSAGVLSVRLHGLADPPMSDPADPGDQGPQAL
ncbi:MAG: Sporulation initiation inhibitor protein Soj [Planctomycetes bacterium ADurb.Bin126]|nr:MAG: Sporulation initiation inhibitor protein Soj [Planctomycetes bacterium ADurb.Bin126]